MSLNLTIKQDINKISNVTLFLKVTVILDNFDYSCFNISGTKN